MNFSEKDLVIFDLDGTLSPSKCPIEADMAILLVQLLGLKKVAVISGSGYAVFETNILSQLPSGSVNLTNLLLLPTSGTRLLVWRGTWCEEYAEHLSPTEKQAIMIALNQALVEAGHDAPFRTYGPVIEDRGSQITFSANGQNAPLAIKQTWDPDGQKRAKIAESLRDRLPTFDIRIGGTNSIDITRRGVNKAYGIRKLEEYLKMSIDKMLFVGDKLEFGGNDYPAKTTGVDCIQVSGPSETAELVTKWIKETGVTTQTQNS